MSRLREKPTVTFRNEKLDEVIFANLLMILFFMQLIYTTFIFFAAQTSRSSCSNS